MRSFGANNAHGQLGRAVPADEPAAAAVDANDGAGSAAPEYTYEKAWILSSVAQDYL